MNIMPSDECPKCGKYIDAATSVEEDAEPGPGDVTVCFGCTGLLKFDDNLKLAELTIEEFDEMDEDEKAGLLKAISIIKSIKRR